MPGSSTLYGENQGTGHAAWKSAKPSEIAPDFGVFRLCIPGKCARRAISRMLPENSPEAHEIGGSSREGELLGVSIMCFATRNSLIGWSKRKLSKVVNYVMAGYGRSNGCRLW